MDFSFKKGWMQVRQKDKAAVKEEILNVFGVKSPSSWYVRRKGKRPLRVDKKAAV